MATYFHGNTELQSGGDGLQTLILMNPSYIGFSDNTQQANQQQNQSPNTNSNSNNLVYLPQHAPPPHFMGIPLSTSSAQDQDAEGFVPRVHYNLYNLPDDAGPAREAQRVSQGLSLSLSSQQAYAIPSRVTGASPPRAEEVRGLSSMSPSPGSRVCNNGLAQDQVFLGSKYLKAAQELLDEVVNVGKGVKCLESANNKAKGSGGVEPSVAASSGGDGEGSGKRGAEPLSTAEKQEIQMKKAKLVNMLDEVEQRYRQYHHQMHIVITWFEQTAGLGSAKTYTALALETISKQFRCLKDAILAQIRAASKSLGEEDGNEGKIEGSRLKYVDNQIRQQRALQQLGMIQQNAWRPQRGLPERAVSVLRAWLFEHFLHPYPKDSDKIMLAKQTGLTRSQVSNWFINARVRLWKPMVEEMYMEEVKEQDKNGSEENNINNGNAKNKTSNNDDSTSKSPAQHASSPVPEIRNMNNFIANQEIAMSMFNSSTSPSGIRNVSQACFNLIGSSKMETIATQGSPKKLRNNTAAADLLHSPNSINNTSSIKFDSNNDNERQIRDSFNLMGAPTNFIGGFGTYNPISELGRFGAEATFQAPPYSGNGTVSLTLGLPHCENTISISGAHHQSFMPSQGLRGVDDQIDETSSFTVMNANANAHASNVYESMNIQDRKRFVAQLLPDFVA